MSFIMNGYLWKVRMVSPYDDVLIDRTGKRTVGVTDIALKTIFVSAALKGDFLTRVVIHELSHAMMFSYGYLSDIHRFCKKSHWVEMEELIANLLADHGYEIFNRAYEITERHIA